MYTSNSSNRQNQHTNDYNANQSQASTAITATTNADLPGAVKSSKKKRKDITECCKHLTTFKNNGGLKIYSKIHSNFVLPLLDQSRNVKAHIVKCYLCERFDGLVHSCLHCVYFGCLKDGHIKSHSHEKDHPLVCDLSSGAVYCYSCADFMFDKDFEALAITNQRKSGALYNLPKTARLTEPTQIDRKQKSTSRETVFVSRESILGLRGLINLGQTCFLNAIVQALVHTPLLRDFFLTESIFCNEMHGASKSKPCIAPLFGNLFQDFYKGCKTPMSLHELLHTMWANANHVSGYDQQDAHEFFMALIQALHEHFVRNKGDECIVDAIFNGSLQSRVTCDRCGHISTTVDPIWDTSLNLVTEDEYHHKTSATSHMFSQQQNIKKLRPGDVILLDECLERYTQLEHLEGVKCNTCQCNQTATKQLAFNEIPMILLLHLKRFKHQGTQSQKIDNIVKFPEHLDMTPYKSDFRQTKKPRTKVLLPTAKIDDNRYVLYAVVNHKGTYEGGHYYSYVRNARDDWYLCDDCIIKRVNLAEVLASPGYLLFYHRESVFYQAAELITPAWFLEHGKKMLEHNIYRHRSKKQDHVGK